MAGRFKKMIEDRTTEWKREYVDDIKKTVIAFANTDGGTIYIGVEDDGSVRGVMDMDDTMLRVMNAVRDSIRPDVTLFVECRPVQTEGKMIAEVSVQRGTARPYYLTGKGIRPEGVYIRQGASTVPASEAAIRDMIKQTGGDSYEDARSMCQSLTFERTETYFRNKGLEFQDAQKRSLGLIGRDGMYTNLAFLLSEQCSHSIKLACFDGAVKTVFRNREEFQGSLLAQMEEAYRFIDRYNSTRSEFEGLYRIDSRDYPPEAVREALLNAIVHREYSFPSSTLISIFEDRMEFVTIGGLPAGISYDDMMLGVSVLRNPHLANICYRLELIEAYGTGIMKIHNAYLEYGVQPKIEVSDHAFKITLPNVNYKEKDMVKEQASGYHVKAEGDEGEKGGVYRERRRGTLGRVAPVTYGRTSREEQVLRMLEETDSIARKDVQESLGISQATAILLLRNMTEEGILIQEGRGRFLRYRLA